MEAVLAHGIEVKQDLPLPLNYLIVGAVSALAISFVGLGALWRTSRFCGNDGGRPVPTAVQSVVDSGPFRRLLRMIGLLLTGFAPQPRSSARTCRATHGWTGIRHLLGGAGSPVPAAGAGVAIAQPRCAPSNMHCPEDAFLDPAVRIGALV